MRDECNWSRDTWTLSYTGFADTWIWIVPRVVLKNTEVHAVKTLKIHFLMISGFGDRKGVHFVVRNSKNQLILLQSTLVWPYFRKKKLSTVSAGTWIIDAKRSLQNFFKIYHIFYQSQKIFLILNFIVLLKCCTWKNMKKYFSRLEKKISTWKKYFS